MQDRYAGDIGDFAKFYLLRNLLQVVDGKIGVVWYKFEDENLNKDGMHISYLCASDQMESSADNNSQNMLSRSLSDETGKDIVEKLSKVVSQLCKRSIEALQKENLLPKDRTVYYSDIVSFPDKNSKEREESRKTWLNGAIKAVSECEIVFLDPDNGLEVNSVKNYRQKSAGKYVYYDEINSFMESQKNKICIIYQHATREKNWWKSKLKILKSNIQKTDVKIRTMIFKKYGSRAFYIIIKGNPSYKECIDLLLKEVEGKSPFELHCLE